MSRNPKDASLPAEKFEPSTSRTVDLTEMEGMESSVILQFADIGKLDRRSKTKEVRSCYGDLYVIVNALRDYANLLESVISEWNLTGFHAARYELHAVRCRKIAGKYAAAIGYDYDKAVEWCEKHRSKDKQSNDTGLDGLEALVRRKESRPSKQEKTNHADSQRKGRSHE